MNFIGNVGRVIVNHGPTIATVVGIGGVVASGVMACKATIKAQPIMVETQAKVEMVKESGYTNKKQYDRDITMEYLKAGKDLVKIYAPSIIVGGLSIGSILYGHNVLCTRNLIMAGAYKALTMDFDAYKDRVIERLGEDNERAIRFDTKQMEYEEIDEDGVIHKKYIEYVPKEMTVGNDRSVFFDERSIHWTENPEENKKFLLKVQERMQKKFDQQGYLFLKDVYEELDVPITYASTVCGWCKGLGDDYIDFGIFDIFSDASRRFVNGFEPIILLNFNDDAYIADRI